MQERKEKIKSHITLLMQMIEAPMFAQLPYKRRQLKFIFNTLVSGFALKFTSEDILHIDQEIKRIEDNYIKCQQDPGDKSSRKKVLMSVTSLYSFCRSLTRIDTTEYNTETYYQKNISELEQEISQLTAKQSEAKQSEDQKEKIQQELEEKKGQLEQIKEEKEELKKKLDAQENLKEKISQAFVELKKHIKSLEVEKKRLNWMFGVYAFLCVCVLALLIYFEFKYLSKWEGIKPEDIKLIDYLPFYIPVPIVGGLLWVFIYQMNRAQRQLMVVANVLYHVDYIEGLLLAINMISPNVAAASEKISQVLDNLIRNYISIPNGQFERSLDTEISKDSINVDPVFDLAKKVKDVIK